MKWENYKVGVTVPGKYKVVLNSDEEKFGGNGSILQKEYEAVKDLCDYKDYAISFDLAPYTAVIFEFEEPRE